MMELALYGAFGDELRKIAGVSLDADTRANMAGRRGLRMGIEFLPGGQLSSNDPKETNFVPKLAALISKDTKKSIKEDLKNARKKFHKGYKKVRDPAASAIAGGAIGTFGSRVLLGGSARGWKGYRFPAVIGAGLGVADYIAQGKGHKKVKTAMMGSGTFTPARSLAQSSAVGSFQDKIVHKGERLRPLKLGQKFTVPGDPTQ